MDKLDNMYNLSTLIIKVYIAMFRATCVGAFFILNFQSHSSYSH